MADDIFSQAGFTLPTAAPAAPAASSPSMFESAGFTLPSTTAPVTAPAGPSWQDAEALENLAAQGVQKPASTTPAKPGRGILRALIDYPGHLLSGLADTVEAPGNVLASKTPSTSESLIPSAVGLAGLTTGSEFPKAGVTAAVEKLAPSSQAVNKLVEAIGPENVPAVVNRLQGNPRLTLADASDPVRTMAQGLIDPAQPKAQNAIVQAVKDRAATRLEAANSAYTQAMGPTPDVPAMVEGLRQRAAQGAGVPTDIARTALDSIMGKSTDPYSVLQQTLKARSDAAAPLYEKALSQPVVWDDRLQQFLDDPIVKSGIAKGVRIQRLESLAEGKPFDPNDYGIKDFDAAGDPIIGPTPNMRTLNVVKKGLDSMVEGSKDSITGRLSEEGRAINGVRSAFLQKLDDINPDYKAARQAWAGPSQAQDAYNRGLNVFQNKAGSSGVNSTPEALASWFNGASQAEQDAVKIGARSAFEQQMRAASDPAARGAALVNKEVNQAKLATLFGKDQADKLSQQMNFKFEDPIGRSFDEGFDVLKNRSGANGLEDRPEFLAKWMKTATPEQVVAKRLGVRLDIDQKINSVKNGALKGETITQIPFNQEKLRTLFGEKEANRLIRVMRDSSDEAATNAKLLAGAKTAETQAGQRALAVPQVGGGNSGNFLQSMGGMAGLAEGASYLASPLIGGYVPGLAATAAGVGRGIGWAASRATQKTMQVNALARNAEFAKGALASGPARQETMRALLNHPKVVRALQKSSNALTAP